jgi:hypothetical protein
METAIQNFQDPSTLVGWSWLLATLIQFPAFVYWIQEQYVKLRESRSFVKDIEYLSYVEKKEDSD